MTLEELDYGEVISIVNGNLASANRLYEEGKINWVERDILISACGLARKDKNAEEKLYKLFQEYLEGEGFEQMKQFVADKSRVTWLIFVKSYKVPKDVPPIEEKRFDLEEHRKKIVIIRNSLIEVFEKK
ncbi:MAG: hypothetical protein ACUVXA_15110 [Candidatus Jordarchaeum sp.]|uniref:hypothetical protein n=1 Tax=Candidatus Jordarchaeum sp. TaxID=2823881 RepID=UPI00404B330D